MVHNGQITGRQGTGTGSETNGRRFTEIPGDMSSEEKFKVDKY